MGTTYRDKNMNRARWQDILGSRFREVPMYLSVFSPGHIKVSMKVTKDHPSKISNFEQLERSLKKIRASTEFEPVTSAIPRCDALATNRAMKPHIGSEVNLLSSYLP